ncbi:RNA methyltransferase [Candidatus Poribacteria bacterium]|nr:MAG: RNA methyltransferase [Candidatus Poribacteria bacterium]
MLISSTRNPAVKLARSLYHKKYRKLHGKFLVEGIRPVKEAVDTGAPVEIIFHCPDRLKSELALRTVEEARRRGIKCLQVSERVMESICMKENPQGIAAVVAKVEKGLEDVEVGDDSLILWAHGIGDPGNLGTMIRTADAFGVDWFILSGRSTDPFDPKSVRASMGSIFNVPIAIEPDPMRVASRLKEEGVKLVATSPSAEKLCFQADYELPLALMVGSEGEGLPEELISLADERIRIPMVGRADSLNVAVATGITLYEIVRSLSPPSSTSRKRLSPRARPS